MSHHTIPDIEAVLDLARHAPSVHNTQPWRFATEGDALVVRRDDERRLPELDPDGRQATISCGAAVHHARLAFVAQGIEPEVAVTRADGEAVEVRISVGPHAEAPAGGAGLAEAARTRHMQRGRFDERPVPAEVVATLRRTVQDEAAWVRFLETPADQVGLAVLLAHADAEERDDEALQAEVAEWTHRPEGRGDGLTPEAASLGAGQRASDLTLREFTAAEDASASGDDPPVAENPLVAVIGTEGDSPRDWLVAGQAMSALLVRAAADGIQASPLGQVLDRAWSRQRLASDLGVLGHPQMVLRLGYAEPGPATPRRSADDVTT